MPASLEQKSPRAQHLYVYGAIGRSSLLGDIHGLVRLVCLARNRHGARTLMLRLPHVSAVALLEPTRSFIERNICTHAESVYTCPLPLMYLAGEHYRRIPLPKTRSRKP